MKILTRQKLVDYGGKNILDFDGSDAEVGRIVARILGLATRCADPIRLDILAKGFHTKNEIELNKSDLDFIFPFIKNTEVYPVMAIAQILESLKEKKDETKI